MKLNLVGHDYKYAVEQMMLALFPGERPEYSEPSPGCLSAVISLTRGTVYATAHTRIFLPGGKRFDGYSRAKSSELEKGRLLATSLEQKIIKLSFFRAGTAAAKNRPVWGALTGIRPGKLITSMLERGLTEKQAASAFLREYFVSPERTSLCIDTAKAGMRVKNSLEPRDICIYVGIPFCPTRCAYCSFVSHSVEKSMKLVAPFYEKLLLEIEETAKTANQLGLRIISVYIGGGTPTTLSADMLDGLLTKLENCFDLSLVREYTVEAGRPDTITEEKLLALRSHGVGRISVNPQTMSDSVLEAIGRRHTAEDVLSAVALVRNSGFESLNTDLIAGLPTDTAEGFRSTLDSVLSLSPENITVHTLSLKRGSRITLEDTAVPMAGEVDKMLGYAAKKLRASGYAPYYLYRQKFMSGGFENVGWCLPGFEGLYNICIMEELCTILALGGGGVTKLVSPGSGRIERIFNPKYPYEYIEGAERIAENKSKITVFYEKEFF